MHLLHTHPDMLEHLKHARLFLETGTARMAAERATEEDVAWLQLSVAQHRASMVDLEEFIERDMAFHREIAKISGNPIFLSIVESLFRWASEYYRPLVRAPGAEELTLAEHSALSMPSRSATATRLRKRCGRISRAPTSCIARSASSGTTTMVRVPSVGGIRGGDVKRAACTHSRPLTRDVVPMGLGWLIGRPEGLISRSYRLADGHSVSGLYED